VDDTSREISYDSVKETIQEAKDQGKKHFIIINNMMTTMFGSVDDVSIYVDVLNELNCSFKIHIDAAFGGFYYPFAEGEESTLTFDNPNISSFTLDAHKMAQAPYGTGIFLIRKGLMEYANTQKAGYIKGEDCTLIGSRSGANAVATWMILVKNGPYGWGEKILILQKRTDWMCEQLTNIGVDYYRHPKSNNITIRSSCVNQEIAEKFGLMRDNQANPGWYKVVVMDHVSIEKLLPLLDSLKEKGCDK